MAKRSAPVTQADVTRALKGVIAAGWTREQIAGVKMTPEGVVVLFGDAKAAQAGPINEWDEVLRS
jgi:hypothetical protein